MESFLLQCLCCPETGQSVRLANKMELEALNRYIRFHSILNRAGQIITLPLEAALIREDGCIAYPIRDNIPILLVEEAIATHSGA